MSAQIKLMVAYRVNEYSKKMAGVFIKFLGQLEGFDESGFEVYALYMSYGSQTLAKFSGGSLEPIHSWLNILADEEKEYFWRNAKEALKLCGAKATYTRYDKMYEKGHLTDFFAFASSIRIINCLELATYPYVEEIACQDKKEGDRKNFASLTTYIDFVFSTSEEKAILGLENNHFVNQLSESFMMKSNQSSESLIGKSNVIHMLAVANVSDWHGFDRVINGLGKYVEQRGKQKVQLHIVGEGDAVPELKSLASSLGLQEIVLFEGHCSGNTLDELYNKASIGVACLGIHRKGLAASSSLKVREYLASGIPVVYSSFDPLVENIEWSLKCPDTDEPVDINKVINFVRECSNQADTRQRIRAFARQEISWRKLSELVMVKIKLIKVENSLEKKRANFSG